MRIAVIFLFLLISVLSGHSQSALRLLNEQELPNCEILLVGVDYLKLALNSEPNSRGAIVISGPSNKIAQRIAFELRVRGALSQRTPELSKNIDVLRGDPTEKLMLRYWIIPQNSSFERPKGWSLSLPSLSKPLLLHSEMAQICEPPPVETLAKELLASNKNGSIFVVIHGPTTNKRNRELKLAKKALASFDPKRTRFFLRTSDTSYSDYYFALGNPPRAAFKSYF